MTTTVMRLVLEIVQIVMTVVATVVVTVAVAIAVLLGDQQALLTCCLSALLLCHFQSMLLGLGKFLLLMYSQLVRGKGYAASDEAETHETDDDTHNNLRCERESIESSSRERLRLFKTEIIDVKNRSNEVSFEQITNTSQHTQNRIQIRRMFSYASHLTSGRESRALIHDRCA